eukprot:1124194-Rhodomonas_salina.1
MLSSSPAPACSSTRPDDFAVETPGRCRCNVSTASETPSETLVTASGVSVFAVRNQRQCSAISMQT